MADKSEMEVYVSVSTLEAIKVLGSYSSAVVTLFVAHMITKYLSERAELNKFHEKYMILSNKISNCVIRLNLIYTQFKRIRKNKLREIKNGKEQFENDLKNTEKNLEETTVELMSLLIEFINLVYDENYGFKSKRDWVKKEIEGWNISSTNESLAISRVLDRAIFIRFGKKRSIERFLKKSRFLKFVKDPLSVDDPKYLEFRTKLIVFLNYQLSGESIGTFKEKRKISA